MANMEYDDEGFDESSPVKEDKKSEPAEQADKSKSKVVKHDLSGVLIPQMKNMQDRIVMQKHDSAKIVAQIDNTDRTRLYFNIDDMDTTIAIFDMRSGVWIKEP